MTQTIAATSPPSSVAHRAPSGSPAETPGRTRRLTPMRARGGPHDSSPVSADTVRRRLDPLGSYTDATGRTREVIAGRRGDGGVLVVDRDAVTLGDRRLVAHLDADEPSENAALVCAHYLRDAHRGRCRRVTVEDLTGRTCIENERLRRPAAWSPHGTELVGRRTGDKDCCAYRLELVRMDGSTTELRWRRHLRRAGSPAPVSLREVVGAIEGYEPVCTPTLRALEVYSPNPKISTAGLRNELERLRESPIVLNRKLRQAVLAAIEHQGLSMSEIAHRCGRVKRDRKGNASGETSWLARRVGVLPDSGAERPSPWIHSDVLALIARNGLGISPREVEL
jgi:hypothetical protein